jgi:hypothetical protein
MFPVKLTTADGVHVFEDAHGFATVAAGACGSKFTVGQVHVRMGGDLFERSEDEEAPDLKGCTLDILVYHQGESHWCRLEGVTFHHEEGPEALGGDTIALYFAAGNPFAADAGFPGGARVAPPVFPPVLPPEAFRAAVAMTLERFNVAGPEYPRTAEVVEQLWATLRPAEGNS